MACCQFKSGSLHLQLKRPFKEVKTPFRRYSKSNYSEPHTSVPAYHKKNREHRPTV